MSLEKTPVADSSHVPSKDVIVYAVSSRGSTAILDGGSNRILFPQNYPHVTSFVPAPSVAHQADGTSTLMIYGEAKYGIFNVLIADVQRPIISEPVLLKPPYNLKIQKEGTHMYIYEEVPFRLMTTATLGSDDLHHPDNINDFHTYQQHKSAQPQTSLASVEDKTYIQGSQRHVNKATRANLNPLETLHIILNHAPEHLIKRLVRLQLIQGLKYTWDEIKHFTLRLCDTCLKARMRAFPVYSPLNPHQYQVMECISVDILDVGRVKTFDGHLFAALFICRACKVKFVYPLTKKSDFLTYFKHVVSKLGNGRVKIINADSGAEELDINLQRFCQEANVQLHLAPPKKPEYSFVESSVGVVKRGTRAALQYNLAPLIWWFRAMRYTVWTDNRLPNSTSDTPPITHFDGTVVDVSHAVPFYATGYHNVTTEEKQSKTFSDNAIRCRMIGYADNLLGGDQYQLSKQAPPNIVSYKQSYLCLKDSGVIVVRHDCYFPIYQDQAGSNLLRPNPAERLAKVVTVPDYNLVYNEAVQVSSAACNDNSNPINNDTVPHCCLPSVSFTTTKKRLLKYLDHIDLPTIDEMTSAVPEHPAWVPTKPAGPIPQSIEEALTNCDKSYWRSSVIREMQGILKRNSWASLSLEDQHRHADKAVRCKYSAFKVKRDEVNSLFRFKSRMTPKGFTQVLGESYTETFAATAKFESICVVLCLCAIFDWLLMGLDVENAFCEGDLQETIYMMLPEQVYRNDDGSPIIVRLLKAMYGLKQAAYVFQCMVRELLAETPCKTCISDSCVFVGMDETQTYIIIIVIWVDDCLITGNWESEIKRLIELFALRFTKVTTEGELKRYVGIDIARDRVNHSMTLSQQPYRQQLVDKYLPKTAATKSNPVNPTNNLRALGDYKEPPIHEQAGELGYLADRTGPEIKFPVSQIRSAAANPTSDHVKAVRHMHRYIAQDTKTGLTYSRGNSTDIVLFGYADGSQIRYGDSKSQLAYCLFLNLFSGCMLARTIKSNSVSLAPSQTELQAVVLIIKKIIWTRHFLAELYQPQVEPTVVYTDSSTLIDQVKSDKIPSTIDHIVLAINFIKEHVMKGTIELRHIDTGNNIADIGTKNLASEPFKHLADRLLHGHRGIAPVSTKQPNKRADNPLVKILANQRKEKRKAGSNNLRFLNTEDN